MSNLKTNKDILQKINQTLNDKGYICELQVKAITPSIVDQIVTFDEGYDGLSKVTIEGGENLVPENIKAGVNIFDIEGEYEDHTFEDDFLLRRLDAYKNNRIKYIGKYAFAYCTSLTSVDFPVCSYIDSRAFYGCTSLTSVSFPACTSVGGNIFADYTTSSTSLKFINFPLCKTIGSSAFYCCKSLTSISFPNCTSIGNYAFDYCTSLMSVSFPECVSIGSYAFYNCKSLTSISFPKCTSIGNTAFRDCSSLTNASFPACATIGGATFYGCSSLTSVSFPACTSIGEYAFGYCSSLTSAYFGNSTISKTAVIYSQTFSSCTNLTNLMLYYPSVATLYNANAFTSTPMSVSTLTGSFGSIYVPASLVDAYKSATNWATYADRITAIPGSATLINFTIDGISYQAEEDMTWEQWVGSSYNTGGYASSGELIVVDSLVVMLYGTPVSSSWKIASGEFMLGRYNSEPT